MEFNMFSSNPNYFEFSPQYANSRGNYVSANSQDFGPHQGNPQFPCQVGDVIVNHLYNPAMASHHVIPNGVQIQLNGNPQFIAMANPSFSVQHGVIVQRNAVEFITYHQVPPPANFSVAIPHYQSHPQFPPSNSTLVKNEPDNGDDHRYLINPNFVPPRQEEILLCFPHNKQYFLNDDFPKMLPWRAPIQLDKFGTRSLRHQKHGPYTCPRCGMEIATSQSFASHMKSHYSTETEEEKRIRIENKGNKKKTKLCKVHSADGLTLVPYHE